ncbi:MBL fold metallo-hydrolase [Thiococcus pfennigii]|uniref:MBL fold metallo-hydrolase n=1 Tax=Thiococcus pfennigii TaxID=1057 RepID=UPI001903AAFE|nr:MBL fold metallo-hydrolase [Thiococcus pfennigii]
MSAFSLRFLGVGNALASTLGTSAAVLEVEGRPSLLIDCGPGTIDAYLGTYGALPEALFVTHTHLDHIGGLEGLFYRLATGLAPVHGAAPRLFCPVPLVAILQQRLADYPSILAEGGRNFWDAFQLIPVSAQFWHERLLFRVFPVRHHDFLTAFGLALPGRFLYTGDTRPIPEVLCRYACHGERIFHDCANARSPSHTGIEDLPLEYQPEQRRRLILYHYESEEAGRRIEEHGYRIARRGEVFDLAAPDDATPGERVRGGETVVRLEAAG